MSAVTVYIPGVYLPHTRKRSRRRYMIPRELLRRDRTLQESGTLCQEFCACIGVVTFQRMNSSRALSAMCSLAEEIHGCRLELVFLLFFSFFFAVSDSSSNTQTFPALWRGCRSGSIDVLYSITTAYFSPGHACCRVLSRVGFSPALPYASNFADAHRVLFAPLGWRKNST